MLGVTSFWSEQECLIRTTRGYGMEKRGSVLGNLDRSWLAAGIDDLRPAPLRDLTGRRLAVVAGKAKPTATLQMTA